MTRPVCVLGRFPPPIDGQSMLTEQMARLLEQSHTIHRINTAFPMDTLEQSVVKLTGQRISHYLSMMRRLRKSLASIPDAPVVWHSISPMPLGHFRDLMVIISALRPQQKTYAVIHWGNFDRLFRSPITRFTARMVVRQMSGFVFLDEGLSEKCAAWIPTEKRFTISNTIDAATRCTETEILEKQSKRIHRKSLRILFLSNMIPAKGYLDVLQAIRLLNAEGHNLIADFIGRWQSDEERSGFLDYVQKHGLQNVVTAHGGIQDRTKVKQFHLNADVFILPTYYPTEAQPLSILEAINAGTPVITTHHAGIPSMVREHANEAIFVPPCSPEAIADALRKLSDKDYWLTFSKASAIRFAEHFSPEVVHQKWDALLAR